MNTDFLQRFLFENHGVRGELVRLTDVYQTIAKQRAYPAPVLSILGEALAATALLSATIKYQGVLILQTQSTGSIHMLVVQCNERLEIRALARWQDDASFQTGGLLGEGHMVITITPDNTTERYQGVVALDSDSLAKNLETYFTQSEQLPTRLWLAVNQNEAVCMLLQKMPAQNYGEKAAGEAWDYWEHIEQLANTITSQELLTLDNETILHRLFHQEDVRLFEEHPVIFCCSCSREKTEQALLTMGEAEVRSILSANKIVEVSCDFCNNAFTFNETEIDTLF